jgi:hypothetical protein
MSVSGSAAQLIATNGPWLRGLSEWMARATNSLPVPLSAVMSTDAVVSATWRISEKISFMAEDPPTRSPQRAPAGYA